MKVTYSLNIISLLLTLLFTQELLAEDTLSNLVKGGNLNVQGVEISFSGIRSGEFQPSNGMPPKEIKEKKKLPSFLQKAVDTGGGGNEDAIFQLGFSTTEITQKQFAAVLGDNEKEKIITSDVVQRAIKNLAYDNNPDSPMPVTLEQAIEFCRALTELNNPPKDSLITTYVTLPTIEEWQYAARGVATKKGILDFPHFYNTEYLSNENFVVRVNDLLESLDRGRRFNGEIEEFTDLLNSASSMKSNTPKRKLHELYIEFIANSTGQPDVVKQSDRDKIKSVNNQDSANPYGLKGMLLGIREWVFTDNAFNEQNFELANDVVAESKFGLAGGGQDLLYNDGAPSVWYKSTIWSAWPWRADTEEEINGVRGELDLQQASDLDYIDAEIGLPGFRVVVKKTINLNYLSLLRNKFYDQLVNAEGLITADYNEIKDVVKAEVEPNKIKNIIDFITYYQSLEAYRTGDKDFYDAISASKLKRFETESDTVFFDLIKGLGD